MAHHVTEVNSKVGHLLDEVINARDDKNRMEAAKKALEAVKQYQSFVASAHLPPAVVTSLKNSLNELARGLAA